MKSSTELRTMLRSIDHKSYPAYKSLAGTYQFGSFLLSIDHVQGDPFASPSSLHVEIPHKNAGFPAFTWEKDCSRIALQDFLTRRLASQFEDFNFKAKGSGKSGLLSITRCGQEVLERSACQISQTGIIARFHVGFPAFGRTINAGELDKILFDFLPRCVENSFFYKKLDPKQVEACVFLAEDQTEVRRILREEKLAAFVANGSILPRKSGVSDLPLKDSVPFVSPASMERTFQLPHRGKITGMAIPSSPWSSTVCCKSCWLNRCSSWATKQMGYSSPLDLWMVISSTASPVWTLAHSNRSWRWMARSKYRTKPPSPRWLPDW